MFVGTYLKIYYVHYIHYVPPRIKHNNLQCFVMWSAILLEYFLLNKFLLWSLTLSQMMEIKLVKSSLTRLDQNYSQVFRSVLLNQTIDFEMFFTL